MAVKDYTATRATAEKMLTKFGGVAAIRVETPGNGPAYAPGTPTTEDYACTIVITDYTANERMGTAIEANDKKVLVSTSGLAITPTVSDKLVVASKAYPIVNIKSLSPAGVVVMWEMQVRR